MELILTTSPNNEITLGLQSVGTRTKKYGDNTQDNIKSRFATHLGNSQVIAYQVGSRGVIERDPKVPGIQVVSRRQMRAAQEAKARSLDIIREVQSKKLEDKRHDTEKRKSKAGWGFLGRVTKFTRLARHRILCAGNILRKTSEEPSESTFVTLTVPGDTPTVAGDIAKWASYLINNLLQVVRNSDKREGTPPTNWFYAWENQKRGVLHLHIVLHSAEPGRSYRLGTDVAECWWRLLKTVSSRCHNDLFTRRNGKECVLPEFWQSDVQPVRKCIASYISKYVSKTSKHPSPTGEKSGCFSPPRWWGMARNLVRAIKEQSSRVVVSNLSEDIATKLYLELRGILESPDRLVQKYSYWFDLNHGDYHVGSGFRDKYYLDSNSHDELSPILGVYLRDAIGRATGLRSDELWGSFSGQGWLYFDSKGVTTISNRAILRWSDF